MTFVGIMQGRLLPPEQGRIQAFPRDSWAKEFPLAKAAGLNCIEWIFDSYGEDVNPLGSAEGRSQLLELQKDHGVSVRSVCADYFMENPLVGVNEHKRSEGISKLKWLVEQCAVIGIARLVLPFIDHSSVRGGDGEEVLDTLNRCLPFCERLGIEIHLEMDLEPQVFSDFLSRLPHQLIKVNYDSGNSASLGYHPTEELGAYGHRVGSVHIKDRIYGGSTVPLGEGNTDFVSLFRGLKKLRYSGDFILQVARGSSGEELEWAKNNRLWLERHMAQDGSISF